MKFTKEVERFNGAPEYGKKTVLTGFGIVSAGAAALLFVILLVFGFAGLTDINPGEVGLKIKMIGDNPGIEKKPMEVGLHWVNPVTYDVVVYDTRLHQYDSDDLHNMPSTTKDGQPVHVDLSLEVGLEHDKVFNLHQTIGIDWFEQVVYPAVRSAVRNNTSKQLSDQIYTGVGRATVQKDIQDFLDNKLADKGIKINVNLRKIDFTNQAFINTLERKAATAQQVLIKEREAEAAQNEAKRMANIAEGKKQERIKAAEADREELRLKGQGERLKQEEEAKGILAIAKAKAEGTRLQVLAYGSGKTYASVQWAKNLGPNVKVYGYPTGAPGTSSLVDLNGVFKGALRGSEQ